jgi:GTPase
MAWSMDELDGAIADFTDIQADINYHDAQQTLKKLLQNFDLTDQEQRWVGGNRRC